MDSTSENRNSTPSQDIDQRDDFTYPSESNRNQEVAYDYHAYAGFWIRLLAYTIDLGVILSLKGILLKPIANLFHWSNSGDFLSPYSITSAIFFYTYFVFMTKFFGQTLGKMIFGIKVIPLKDPQLTWITVLIRELAGRYISASFLLLYTIAAFTPKKQSLHDIFADTAVIHEDVILRKPIVSLK